MASMLDTITAQEDVAVGFLFNNYVYTVIEKTIHAVITNTAALVQEEPECEISEESSRIIRSYSDEEDAQRFCRTMNENRFEKNKVESWIEKKFGTSNAYSAIDPKSGFYRIHVKVFSYVKNELHGSVLEREQFC